MLEHFVERKPLIYEEWVPDAKIKNCINDDAEQLACFSKRSFVGTLDGVLKMGFLVENSPFSLSFTVKYFNFYSACCDMVESTVPISQISWVKELDLWTHIAKSIILNIFTLKKVGSKKALLLVNSSRNNNFNTPSKDRSSLSRKKTDSHFTNKIAWYYYISFF